MKRRSKTLTARPDAAPPGRVRPAVRATKADLQNELAALRSKVDRGSEELSACKDELREARRQQDRDGWSIHTPAPRVADRYRKAAAAGVRSRARSGRPTVRKGGASGD